MRGETTDGLLLVDKPAGMKSHDVVLGRGERFPTCGWSFTFAATPLGVGDSLAGGQRSAFGPCCVKGVLFQRFTHCRHRGIVGGLEDLEADLAVPLANTVGRAQQACSVLVVGFGGE